MQTTTTTVATTKKPAESKPVANNERIEIYALDATGFDDAWTYSDINCTEAVAGYIRGTKLIAVKSYKDKGVYLLDDGSYARMSDFTTTPFIVEEWFNTATFDAKKVRQYMIDIATKELGLVLNEKMTVDNSSWFPPLCFPCAKDDGYLNKVQCSRAPSVDCRMGNMKKGDYFNVVIKYVDAEEMFTHGGGTAGEGYVIFFLR